MICFDFVGPKRPLKIIRGKFASAAIYGPEFANYRTSLRMSPCKTYQVAWLGDTSLTATPCTFLGLHGGAGSVLDQVRKYLTYNDQVCEYAEAEIRATEARLAADPRVARMRARRVTH